MAKENISERHNIVPSVMCAFIFVFTPVIQTKSGQSFMQKKKNENDKTCNNWYEIFGLNSTSQEQFVRFRSNLMNILGMTCPMFSPIKVCATEK